MQKVRITEEEHETITRVRDFNKSQYLLVLDEDGSWVLAYLHDFATRVLVALDPKSANRWPLPAQENRVARPFYGTIEVLNNAE